MKSIQGRWGRAPSSPVRILLVGYGIRGRQWQAMCARRRVFDVAVVDPDHSSRRAAARQGLETWDSLDRAIGEARARGAIVATPSELHLEHALACLEAGIVTLVEKPMALSVRDAAEVVAVEDGGTARVVVGQNFRFLPREQAVRTSIAAGAIGELTAMFVSSARPPSVASPKLPGIHQPALWNMGAHHLDAVLGRVGSLPALVRTDASPDGLRGEVVAEWEGGLRLEYRFREDADGYMHRETIRGTGGTLTVERQRVVLHQLGRSPRAIRSPRKAVPEEPVIDVFLRALEGGSVVSLGARENLATLAFVEAADRSVQVRGSVAPADVLRAAGLELPEPAPIRT